MVGDIRLLITTSIAFHPDIIIKTLTIRRFRNKGAGAREINGRHILTSLR